MDKVVRRFNLLASISEDWHQLCDQYQLEDKPAFAKDAGLVQEKNDGLEEEDKQLFEILENLVKPIQRYHRLPRLIRWFWRWFWSVDDLYQPLITYYAENKHLTWEGFSNQLSQRIQRLELFVIWIQKKTNIIQIKPTVFTDLEGGKKTKFNDQQQGQNIIKTTLTNQKNIKEANKMTRQSEMFFRRRFANKKQFDKELEHFYHGALLKINEIEKNQDYCLEDMIKHINEILKSHRQNLDELCKRLALKVKDNSYLQEQCGLKKRVLHAYFSQVIRYRFEGELKQLFEAGLKQVDAIEMDHSLSIVESLEELANTLGNIQVASYTLFRRYAVCVDDSRYYENEYKKSEHEFGLYMSEAVNRLDVHRKENLRKFQSEIETKAKNYRKFMKDAIQENQGLPGRQWQAIEDHLSQACQGVEELGTQYRESGRAYDEKTLSEYETFKQEIVGKLTTYARHLQQSTGGLVPHNRWAQNNVQLTVFWQYDHSNLKKWMVEHARMLGRITDAKLRRSAIGYALIELENKFKELRIKYHPDKYPETLKTQVEWINKNGIEKIAREASFWLMVGSQCYAKYAPKKQENELDLDKLADEGEQKKTDYVVRFQVSCSRIGINAQYEKRLRQHYDVSAKLSSYLKNLHHYYRCLERKHASGEVQSNILFWQACIQWYEYSIDIWHHFFNIWESFHFLKPCKNEDDKNELKLCDANISQLHQYFQEEIFPALDTITQQLVDQFSEKITSSLSQDFSELLIDLHTLHDLHKERISADEKTEEIQEEFQEELKLCLKDKIRKTPFDKMIKKEIDYIDLANEKLLQFAKFATVNLAKAAVIQRQCHQDKSDLAFYDTSPDEKNCEQKISTSEKLAIIQIQLERQYKIFIDNREKAEAEGQDLNLSELFIWLCRCQIKGLRWVQTQKGLTQTSALLENKLQEMFHMTLNSLKQYCNTYQEAADECARAVKINQEFAEYKAEVEKKKLKAETGNLEQTVKSGTRKRAMCANFFKCITADDTLGDEEISQESTAEACQQTSSYSPMDR